MPTITVPQDESATTNYVKTVLGPNVEVFAQHIEVRYKNGDLEIDASTTKIASSRLASLTSAAPSRPTLSENETSATSENPAETSGANGTSTDDNASVAKHEDKKGLTASAYAGIGVGIAAALVALVGTSLCFLRRRNKTKKPTETAATGWRQMASAAEIANSTPVCEVGSREAAEVRGDHALPAELDPNRVHQLE
ncbi:hypothetical protein SLS60_003729 [Paraconiothyrium brasiliense]|uniref:Uncharacterized protein n=1 Tax=Paraconiothyrium brasiliense TaxID=300254 RepID=A0ABR3RQY8_9PLEO